MAVSLSVAISEASLPVAWQRYLPEAWAEDAARRKRAKLRWRIERDCLELKQELGLGHYEGRGWPGFHPHGASCIAAYGCLVAEKAAIPPSAKETARMVQAPEFPPGHRPRGSPPSNRATRARLNRNTATTNRTRPGEKPTPMPMLHPDHQTSIQCSKRFMTQ